MKHPQYNPRSVFDELNKNASVVRWCGCTLNINVNLIILPENTAFIKLEQNLQLKSHPPTNVSVHAWNGFAQCKITFKVLNQSILKHFAQWTRNSTHPSRVSREQQLLPSRKKPRADPDARVPSSGPKYWDTLMLIRHSPATGWF